MVCTFVTHPEVVVDPAGPIELWRLSEAGRGRASRLPAELPADVRTIVSSAERKAIDTAQILADALGLPVFVDRALGEMDRSSTGYLPPDEFDRVVESFFARPEVSVRGWERAVDAQRRIVEAVRRHPGDGVVFTAHGGVGALLLASLSATPISRAFDQPGLGSCFAFDARAWTPLSGWRRIP